MNDLRVVFFGTGEFAVSILETLLEEKYNVVGVVSQPDKPVGRKKVLMPTPVHAYADAHGIPVLQPARLKEDYQGILDLSADLIVTCAYGQIVPDVILNSPKYGCVNIHPSDLPKYRGGAPIQRAVWNGDPMTAVCLMEMVHRMDAGRVWARVYEPVPEDATSAQMFTRLAVVASELVRKNLPLYLEGKLEGEVQDETKVVIAPNIAREEEQVVFAVETLNQAYNHIRALLDEPVAYGIVEGKRMKFYGARKKECTVNEVPGTILGFTDHAMNVACIGGVLQITKLQPEGKKPMDADAFANGAGKSFIGKQFA